MMISEEPPSFQEVSNVRKKPPQHLGDDQLNSKFDHQITLRDSKIENQSTIPLTSGIIERQGMRHQSHNQPSLGQHIKKRQHLVRDSIDVSQQQQHQHFSQIYNAYGQSTTSNNIDGDKGQRRSNVNNTLAQFNQKRTVNLGGAGHNALLPIPAIKSGTHQPVMVKERSGMSHSRASKGDEYSMNQSERKLMGHMGLYLGGASDIDQSDCYDHARSANNHQSEADYQHDFYENKQDVETKVFKKDDI